MKKSFKILFLIVIGFAFTFKGFSQTADVVKGCVPLTVSFTAPSGASTYYWDFKDGVTSNINNPTNIFNKSGVYYVTFQNSFNGPVIGTIQIQVYPSPALNISVQSGCAPLNATFTNKSVIDPGITVNKYTWFFGDGNTGSGFSASNVYNNVGNYSVSLNISTQYPSCNKTDIFNNALTVYAQPVASFTTNPATTVTCKDTINVAFTNTSTGAQPLSYLWNLGNGKTYSSQNPPPQMYLSGQYNASLNVSYPSGFLGCSSTAGIGIGAGKPNPVIIKSKDTVCLNSYLTLKTKTPGLYQWTLDGNTTNASPSANLDSIIVSFNTPGFHTVSLTVSSFDGLCSTTKSVSIYVDQVTVNIVTNPTYSCSSPMTIQLKAIPNQTNVKYFWSFTDGTIDTVHQSVTKTFYSSTNKIYYGINTFEQVGAYYVSVTSIKTGCFSNATYIDTMWLPNARFMPDVSMGCSPLTVTFSDSSTSNNPIVKWDWLFGDGTSQVSSSKIRPTHTYNTPGVYPAKLVVTTARGCIDTSYAINIQVGTILTSGVDFTVDKTSVCPGQPVQFTPVISAANAKLIDAYHFTTEGNRSFQCSSEKSLTWSYNNLAGPQDVSLKVEYNGCITTVTKKALVTVNGAIADIDYTALCSNPLSYAFIDSSKNATSVSWNFGDGGVSPLSNVSHLYTASGDYSVILTAINTSSGCAATTDTVIVHARKIKAKIKIDSLLCVNQLYTLDGSTSIDVYHNCHMGYTWSFPQLGRPFTYDVPTALVSFPSGGVYKGILIVKDINGCVDTAKTSVKVYGITPLIAADDNSICLPNTVHFTDKTKSDTTIVAWNWSFGDSTSAFSQNPAHLYSKAPASGSSYNVILSVTDKLGCVNFTTYTINTYSPSSSIVIPRAALCLGQTASISATDFTTGGSHLTYKWNFGNGQTSTNQSQTILYTKDTIYTVKLIYQEAATGCVDSTSTTVSVQTYPKAGMMTSVDSLAVLCAPQNIIFSDSSTSKYPLNYSWNFGNGQTSGLSTYALFYAKGNYTVKYIVQTANGCADSVSRKFKVYSPEGNFTASQDSICKSQSITFKIVDTADVTSYSWAFGDGIIAANTAPVTHVYNFHPPSGQTVAKLSLVGAEGCQVQLQTPIYIRQVVAGFQRAKGGLDTSICFNDGPFPFANTSYDSVGMANLSNTLSYVWSFGDGQTSSQMNPGTHAYATPGVYNVSLFVNDPQFGCKDTLTKKAVIYKNPATIATGDTVCQGKQIFLHILHPDTLSTFLWSPPQYLSSATSTNPISSNPHTQIYTLVETDTNKCTTTIQIPAVVIEPIGLSNYDTSIVIGDSIHLNGSRLQPPNVYNYIWSPTTALSCSYCYSPWAQPLQSTIYNFNVTDKRNCFTNNYSYNIVVRPQTFVKMPTAFAPDGPPDDRILYVRGWGIKQLLEFQVYNRWGQLLYSSNNINEGWDGTFNGQLQSSDVYVYKVKALTWKDAEIKQEGYVNLIR